MKKVEIILKVTDKCNLRCAYCYNSEKGYADNLLPLERFEKLLNVLLTDYNMIHVIWHGGEPLCAGLDYFRAAMDVEKRVSIKSGIIIENSIQTNGTLINAEWINFFKQNKFKIGISFDGVDNGKYRQQTEKTLKAMQSIKAAGADFSCIAVVADDSYDLKENYKFFAERNISFDFNPVFAEGAAKDLHGLQMKNYAEKCVELFDEWLYDKDGVSVRTFSFYAGLAVGGKFRVCTCCSCHTKYLSLAPDGTLYNCGREGLTAYPFGNVDDVQSVSDIFLSDGARRLIKGSIERRDKCKQSCEYFELCAGGCADIAIMENGLTEKPENYCYFFKRVYGHVSKTIKGLLERQVPLTEFNPALKRVLANSLARMDGSIKNDLAEKYIK